MITVILDAMGLPAVADWVDTMDAMPALQDSSYRQVQDSPRSARYAYEATCVAIVNLAGLTGEQLGEDFIEWRTQYEEGDDPSNEGDAPSDEGTE
jgi:hypothetical protein